MLSQPCGTFIGVLVLAASTWQQAHAATITFDWNTGPGDGTVPDRFSSDIVATVGDELVLSWQDPTTTPSGTMFHEVVPMADNSCTFATGYAIATQIDVTNGGVKAAISSTIALDTAGTFYFSCGVGSAAWCATNTSTVQMATGGYGCTGEQAWAHCGTVFKQKITVVVRPPTKTSNAASSFGVVGAATAMVIVTASWWL